MDFKELDCYECTAIETVAAVINGAKTRLGIHATLHNLIQTRAFFKQKQIVQIPDFREPATSFGILVIRKAIETSWHLTLDLMYTLKFVETKVDYISHYFYYEAIFSQPVSKYPVPQATVSVFFIMKIKRLGPADRKEVPKITYRLEGHHSQHDIRFVKLLPDSILGVLRMKILFFERIESMKMF